MRAARWILVWLAACSTSREPEPAKQTAPADAAIALAPPTDAAIDAPTGPVYEFVRPPMTPGTSSIIEFEATLDLDVDFGGFDTRTSSRQSKKKKVQIVGVDADGTVHKRITYIKRRTDIVIDDVKQKDDTRLPGKTFLVALKDGEVASVRRGNGKAASAVEVEQVGKEEVMMQGPELLGLHLAGMKLTEGVPYEPPLDAVRPFLSSAYDIDRVVLTYRGKVGDNHLLLADVSMSPREGQGSEMYIEIDAELLMDPTGWCLSADVTMQIRAEFAGVVVGSGAGVGAVKATPLQAAGR